MENNETKKLNLKNFEEHYEIITKTGNFFTLRTMIIACLAGIFMSLPVEGIPYLFYENEFYCKAFLNKTPISERTQLVKCSQAYACRENTVRGIDYILGDNIDKSKANEYYESLISYYGLECDTMETFLFPMFYNISSITGSLIGIVFMLWFNTKSLIDFLIFFQFGLHLLFFLIKNLYLSYFTYFLMSQNYHLYHTLIGIYIAEFTLSSLRSKCLSTLVAMNGICGLISLGIFFYFKSYLYNFEIFSIGLLASAMLFYLFNLESIRYNISKGNIKQAEKDLKYVSEVNNTFKEYKLYLESLSVNVSRRNSYKTIPISEEDDHSLHQIEIDLQLNSSQNRIFEKEVMKAILIISCLFGINYSIETNLDLTLADNEISITERILFYLFEIVLCFISHLPMEIKSIGRKGLLIISMVVLIILFFQKYFIMENNNSVKWLLIVIKSTQVFFETTLYVFSAESFSTSVRRNGIFLSKIIARIVISAYPFFVLTNHLVTMIITNVLLGVGLVFILFFRIENSEFDEKEKEKEIDEKEKEKEGKIRSLKARDLLENECLK